MKTRGGWRFGVLDFGVVDAEGGAVGVEFWAVFGLEVDGYVFLEREDFESKVAGGEFRGVAAQADFEGGAVLKVVIEQSAVEREPCDIACVVNPENGIRCHIHIGGAAGTTQRFARAGFEFSQVKRLGLPV